MFSALAFGFWRFDLVVDTVRELGNSILKQKYVFLSHLIFSVRGMHFSDIRLSNMGWVVSTVRSTC